MALRRRHRDRRSSAEPGASTFAERRRVDPRQHVVEQALAQGSLRATGQRIIDLGSGRVVGVDTCVMSAGWEGVVSETRLARGLLNSCDDGAVVTLNRLLIDELGTGADTARATSGSDRQPECIVSVPIDGRFVATDDFLTEVKSAVRRAELEPTQLVLSIEAKPGFEPVWSKLQRLKSHGVQVALDEFVLGSAPTDLLRRYPIDIVRFAAGVVDDGELLDATVRLAHNLGCTALADRVDTAAGAELLTDAGVDLATGSHYEPG